MRVPMLCYHRIEEPPPHASGDTNFVRPAHFAAHLSALARLGFHGVTVHDVLSWKAGRSTLPPHPIAITFDDAYESVVTTALPLMGVYRWQATVYAISGYLGERNTWDPGAPPARQLDAAALRTILADGHDVGSHTRHHQRVRGLNGVQLQEELASSKDDLEQQLGTACTSVAFPFGTHDRTVLDATQDAGYLGACTLKRWANGRRTNAFRLGRMSVGGPLPPWLLLAKLGKLMLTPSANQSPSVNTR